MTYYPDLTPYQYCSGEDKLDVPRLNIGWLDGSQPFLTGETSDEFQNALLGFCFYEYVVRKKRGAHHCDLGDCPFPVPPVKRNERIAYFGNAEIRVVGDEVVFAAPSLIYHYVVVHNYHPPNDFVQAVLTSPQPGSDRHQAVIDEVNKIESKWT